MPRSPTPSVPDNRGTEAPLRRSYDSPVRRQKAAQTRTRILAAGAALARQSADWDWPELTFRAVAARAGVSERTVFRYFGTERDLHRAVMRQLEVEAGVEYQGLELSQLGPMARRVFVAMSRFAVAGSPTTAPNIDATLTEEDDRRRDALLVAVSRETAAWSEVERRMASGILDVLWHVPAYDRLVNSWDLDADSAIAALEWALSLVVDAVQSGRRPPTNSLSPHPPQERMNRDKEA